MPTTSSRCMIIVAYMFRQPSGFYRSYSNFLNEKSLPIPRGKTLKYPPGKSSGMKKILVITLTLGFCLVLAMVAGCSQPAAAPVATPAPTNIETTIATVAPTAISTTADSITPGPTQTLPDIWSIEIQVGSNGEAINPQITTTLRGGKGMNVIPEIDVKITRSDGVVEEDRMVQPLHVGKTVVLAGTTKNTDRAEVWVVTPNNEKVKIYDAYVPFRSYN